MLVRGRPFATMATVSPMAVLAQLAPIQTAIGHLHVRRLLCPGRPMRGPGVGSDYF